MIECSVYKYMDKSEGSSTNSSGIQNHTGEGETR